MVIKVVITVTQIVATTLFLIKTRKIVEINWLPKVMMIMALLSTGFRLVWITLNLKEIEDDYMYYMSPAWRIIDTINYGLLFRF